MFIDGKNKTAGKQAVLALCLPNLGFTPFVLVCVPLDLAI